MFTQSFDYLRAWLRHQFSAQGLHLLHSPFVFEFATEVLPHRSSEQGRQIRAFHQELKKRKERISWEDLGAGVKDSGASHRKASLGRIATSSACGPRKGEFLYRLCKHYQPGSCLEIGSNLGISTLYQHSAIPQSKFLTLEGAEPLAQMARQHLDQFGLQAEVMLGEFSQSLSQIDLGSLDLEYIYVDGNHQYQPTLDYFSCLLPHLKDGGLIVFDDIHWSKGMEAAWQEICQHPEVSVSIDLFWLGLCFVRRPQARQHFTLRAF